VLSGEVSLYISLLSTNNTARERDGHKPWYVEKTKLGPLDISYVKKAVPLLKNPSPSNREHPHTRPSDKDKVYPGRRRWLLPPASGRNYQSPLPAQPRKKALGPAASGRGLDCSVEVEDRRSSVEVDVREELFQM
jgi:hypothetical protein